MNLKKSPESVVAFLDILGYKSFLKSNSSLSVADEIFDFIQEAPEKARKHWLSSLNNPSVLSQLEAVQSVVFSDTILIAAKIDDDGRCEQQYLAISALVMEITRSMFDFGMPIRGCITRGPFVYKNTCIAGEAVVEAHLIAECLDFSGVVFSNAATRDLDKLEEKSEESWEEYFPYFLWMTNSGIEHRTRILNWRPDETSILSKSQVRNSFWKWGKDIPIKVESKIENTTKSIQFLAHVTERENKPNLSSSEAISESSESSSLP